MTVKWNYFKFTLILHPIIYLTWSPKAREIPLVANNCSNNEKAKGMWSWTWPDSECVLPTAVTILNIQRSARELKPVYTSLQLLLVQVRSLSNTVNCSQSIFFAVPFCTFQVPAAASSALLPHCHICDGRNQWKVKQHWINNENDDRYNESISLPLHCKQFSPDYYRPSVTLHPSKTCYSKKVWV